MSIVHHHEEAGQPDQIGQSLQSHPFSPHHLEISNRVIPPKLYTLDHLPVNGILLDDNFSNFTGPIELISLVPKKLDPHSGRWVDIISEPTKLVDQIDQSDRFQTTDSPPQTRIRSPSPLAQPVVHQPQLESKINERIQSKDIQKHSTASGSSLPNLSPISLDHHLPSVIALNSSPKNQKRKRNDPTSDKSSSNQTKRLDLKASSHLPTLSNLDEPSISHPFKHTQNSNKKPQQKTRRTRSSLPNQLAKSGSSNLPIINASSSKDQCTNLRRSSRIKARSSIS